MTNVYQNARVIGYGLNPEATEAFRYIGSSRIKIAWLISSHHTKGVPGLNHWKGALSKRHYWTTALMNFWHGRGSRSNIQKWQIRSILISCSMDQTVLDIWRSYANLRIHIVFCLPKRCNDLNAEKTRIQKRFWQVCWMKTFSLKFLQTLHHIRGLSPQYHQAPCTSESLTGTLTRIIWFHLEVTRPRLNQSFLIIQTQTGCFVMRERRVIISSKRTVRAQPLQLTHLLIWKPPYVPSTARKDMRFLKPWRMKLFQKKIFFQSLEDLSTSVIFFVTSYVRD